LILLIKFHIINEVDKNLKTDKIALDLLSYLVRKSITHLHHMIKTSHFKLKVMNKYLLILQLYIKIVKYWCTCFFLYLNK
jgi:hypothetical protein